MLLPSKPALLAAAVVLAADSVPTFEVDAFCHRVAALAWPVGDADVCLRRNGRRATSWRGIGHSFTPPTGHTAKS
jgi:hypothetical protein